MLVTVPVGSKVRLTATFKNDSGALDDPSTVVYRVVPPAGDATLARHYTYGTDGALIRDSIGVYHLDLIIDNSGDWRWSAEGTGNVEAYHESLIVGQTRQIAEAV